MESMESDERIKEYICYFINNSYEEWKEFKKSIETLLRIRKECDGELDEIINRIINLYGDLVIEHSKNIIGKNYGEE